MNADSKAELLSSLKVSRRRRFLQRAGIVGAAAVGAGALGLGQEKADAAESTSFGAKGHKFHVADTDILNFALNLEYLEANYYLLATTGAGLPASAITGTGTQGTVTGGSQVTFANSTVKQMATEIANDEMNHVLALRAALGKKAVAQPAIDFTTAFTNAAIAAGVITAGQTFTPFDNDADFLLGAFVFEDVGVTAYSGAAPFITKSEYLAAAAAILSIEAYHGGAVRTMLFTLGQTTPALITIANAISALRASADGSGGAGHEEPLVSNGSLVIAPADANSLAFARTFSEVLNIVYLGGAAANFGFFPNKLNGRIF